ncbi:MAG: hypothetical protein K2F64_02955 [Muribaculaceae bacterium]|nr:hypothetical protein [Muribaculaceae bacterium]
MLCHLPNGSLNPDTLLNSYLDGREARLVKALHQYTWHAVKRIRATSLSPMR